MGRLSCLLISIWLLQPFNSFAHYTCGGTPDGPLPSAGGCAAPAPVCRWDFSLRAELRTKCLLAIDKRDEFKQIKEAINQLIDPDISCAQTVNFCDFDLGQNPDPDPDTECDAFLTHYDENIRSWQDTDLGCTATDHGPDIHYNFSATEVEANTRATNCRDRLDTFIDDISTAYEGAEATMPGNAAANAHLNHVVDPGGPVTSNADDYDTQNGTGDVCTAGTADCEAANLVYAKSITRGGDPLPPNAGYVSQLAFSIIGGFSYDAAAANPGNSDVQDSFDDVKTILETYCNPTDYDL